MVSGHVYIATSLDGFIAKSNGDVDWLHDLPPVDGDYGYGAFMQTMDGLVMGRSTYEKVMTFGDWPYTKPVVVVSRSLNSRDLPDHLRDKVEFSSAEPAALMKALGQRGWKNAYVDGGKLVQSFLRANLIQRLVLSRVPVLLGGGIPLFGELDSPRTLEHVRTEAFSSGLVQSEYLLNT